jgi:hypothetical protein
MSYNPQQPQGGYGMPPQPQPKKGMSTGVKVLIAVIIFVIIGGVLLLALGVGGYFLLRNKAQEMVSTSSPSGSGLSGSSSSSSSSSADDAAEAPNPTSEQQAAIAGGQSATWGQQEISWTVPQRWHQTNADSNSFMWQSPGSSDAAFLIVSISAMSGSFPTDISTKAFYDQAQTRKQQGEVAEVHWLKLGGVKGVMFRESSPEHSDSPQRLQWMGYRNYKGQTQLVNIMLSSQGKHFAEHEDALYGILYSTKLGQ